MSKSFTASAILLLRDEGALRLDDQAAAYVPDLAGWVYGAADAAPVTIRHLLTMTAGFPTDDPWGDRQQGLPLEEFQALLAGGVSFNWAPGTRFEYSNLGYAILGLVVAAASGVPYDEFIRTRLLAPLRHEPHRVHRGGVPRRRAGGRLPPRAGRLAGAAVRPLRRVRPDGRRVLLRRRPRHLDGRVRGGVPAGRRRPAPAAAASRWRPASRRQMQLPQAVTGWRAPDRIPGGPPAAPSYYGFGLFVDEDPALGRVVSHSGGYPGFGSNMRWHPATGLAVIALGNGTYSPMYALAELVLGALLTRSAAYHVALAPALSGSSGPARPPAGRGRRPWRRPTR